MKTILTAICALAIACAATAKLNVVATTSDLGSIAKEIGGNAVDVTTLAKPTEDPHFVDARPTLIVRLNHADVLIEGGAELELGWLPTLLDGARNTKLEAGKPGHVMASEGIQLLEVPTTLDRSKGDIHAAGNPHFMTDPQSGKVVAEHIARVFSALDPKSQSTYQSNLEKFNSALDAKMTEWTKLLAPYKGKEVVCYHNSWPYFAKRFGLDMDVFLEPKPGIPPTPSHLAEVITKMKADNINTIIVEPYLSRKTAEAVARHTGATVVDVESMPTEKESYVEWMDKLVKSIASGLSKKS
jgi:zinc/manganese transport system substrate-binding protein